MDYPDKIRNPIKLSFDPDNSDDADLRKVFDDNIARTFWLLWRPWHLVNQHFNKECLGFSTLFQSKPPQNKDQFIRFLTTYYGWGRMFGVDNIMFCIPQKYYRTDEERDKEEKELRDYMSSLWPYFRDNCDILKFIIEKDNDPNL